MRSIDHFVLATAGLAAARERYRRMGFTVAPDGVHPFGTHNANLYFRDGPMVETLAVHDPARYAEAVAAGNSFVRNDAAFRAARGDEGFSHIVLTSPDAERDHAAFRAQGVSGGDIVAFSRQFRRPDGSLDRVAAKLAFATHPAAPAGLFFTCEDIVVPDIDRAALLDHANGARGARQVISCAARPSDYVGFVEALLETPAEPSGPHRADWALPNGRVSILTPAALAAAYGVEVPGVDGDFSQGGLLHCGLLFAVTDLAQTEALFARTGQPFARRAGRLVVVPAAGVFFGFEDAENPVR